MMRTTISENPRNQHKYTISHLSASKTNNQLKTSFNNFCKTWSCFALFKKKIIWKDNCLMYVMQI